jgi:hypothetical protein
MSWGPRRQRQFKWWRPRRAGAGRRLRLPFSAGWVALIAGGATSYLLLIPTPGLSRSEGATYQCRHNAYNCGDFRTRIEAQTAYLACGGLGNDVHGLDEDRDP